MKGYDQCSLLFIVIGLFLCHPVFIRAEQKVISIEDYCTNHICVVFDDGSRFFCEDVSITPSWSEVNFESFSLSSLLS